MTKRERIIEAINRSYHACLHGDYRCFAECPYLEQCWSKEKEEKKDGDTIMPRM